MEADDANRDAYQKYLEERKFLVLPNETAQQFDKSTNTCRRCPCTVHHVY
jgi:hypothetical protein